MTTPSGSPFPPATLGGRIGANLLDSALSSWPFVVIVGGVAAMSLEAVVAGYLLLTVSGLVVGLLNWGLTATRGHTIGQRMVGIRVLDEQTGFPIGWGRAFVRQLVLSLLGVTLVGLIANAFVINGSPRRQGWHDGAGRAVVVRPDRHRPTARAAAAAAPWTGPAATPEPAGRGLATPRPASGADAPPSRVPDTAPAGLRPAVLAAPIDETLTPATAAPVIGVPDFARVDERPAPAAPPAPAAVPVVARHVLVLDDGDQLPDGPRLVLGRDPVADGHLAVPLRDDAHALSKTHAALRYDGRGWQVEDLHSTNGVAVRRGGEVLLAEPGTPLSLIAGDWVLLGERTVEVRP